MSDSEFVAQLDHYRNEFFRYVHRNVWNADVAEDVFSSAVLAAYKNLAKFEVGSNFRAWMYRILTNKCFVANRETRRLGIDIDSIDDQLLAVDPSQIQALDNPEWFLETCGDEVNAALLLLSTSERSCFLLLSIGKYSYKEIAGILEMPVGTVLTHLARGRAKMRRRLVDYAVNKGIISSDKASKTRTDPRAQAS